MDLSQPTTQSRRFTLETVGKFIKQNWLNYLTLFLIAGALIFLDQWTKALVRAYVPLGTDWLPEKLAWLAPYARVRSWYNSGAAFGFFREANLILASLAVIVSVFILYYVPRISRQDWWLRLAVSMQFAGAIGNLIDRIRFGHVTDFISVGNFAIFNIADSSITVGVAILILGVWLKERAEKKQAAASLPAETGTKSE